MELEPIRARLKLDTADLRRALRQATSATTRASARMSAAFKRVSSSLLSLRTALASLAGGLAFGKILQLTARQERAIAQMDAILKATGYSVRLTREEMVRFAAALQDVTTYGDEAIIELQNVLLTFRDIQGPQFKRAVEVILDMASVLGTDLRSAAIQVGKALNDPAIGASMLRRVGVSFSEEQLRVIKYLQQTNRLAEAQKLMLAELEREFGGAAEAARNTFGGALQAVQNRIADLLEAKSGLPEAAAKLNELEDLLKDPEVQRAADQFISSLVSGFADLMQSLPDVIKGIEDLGDRLRTASRWAATIGGGLVGARVGAVAGPVGAAVGAAAGATIGAVMTTSEEEIRRMNAALEDADDDVDDLIEALDDLDRKKGALVLSAGKIADALDREAASARAFGATLDELHGAMSSALATFAEGGTAAGQAMRDAAEGSDAAAAASKSAADAADELLDRYKEEAELAEKRKKLQQSIFSLIREVDPTAEMAARLKKLEQALQDARAAAPEFADALERAVEVARVRLEAARAEVEKLNELTPQQVAHWDELRRVVEQYDPVTVLQEEVARLEELQRLFPEAAATIQKAIDDVRTQIARARQEAEEMQGLTPEQRARYDDLRRVIEEVDPMEPLRRELETLDELLQLFPDRAEVIMERMLQINERMDQMGEKQKRQMDDLSKASENLAQAIGTAFEDAVIEGKDFGDVLRGLEQDIMRIMMRTLVTKPLERAVSGFAESILGGIFGGGGLFGGGAAPTPKQHGGFFSAGQQLLVGERGPEVVRFPRPGYVAPTQELRRGGAGKGVSITVNINNPQSGDDVRLAASQAAAQLALAVQRGGRNL